MPKCKERRYATVLRLQFQLMVIERNAREGRPFRVLVWASVALVLLDVAVYLTVVRAQGGTDPSDAFTVPFVAGYLVVMAIILSLSQSEGPRLAAMRPVLRTAAAAGLLVLGVFALFSIGLPIFLAGVLATVGAIRAMTVPHLSRLTGLFEIAAAAIAVTVLVGGFVVGQEVIVCPPHGTMSGTTSSFITGGYSYQCNDGRLTLQSGNCNSGSGTIASNGTMTASSC
jgi:hypothetical protein